MTFFRSVLTGSAAGGACGLMATSYLIGVIQLSDKQNFKNVYALGILSLLAPPVSMVAGATTGAFFYVARRGVVCLRNAPRSVQITTLLCTVTSGMVLHGTNDIRKRVTQ